MRYYQVDGVREPRYSGSYWAEHRWGLPGVHCPQCDAVWSSNVDAYPSVDLSRLPDQEKYTARLEENYAEFERLREQVRPLVPPGVPLWPGTELGPLTGTAQGEFGPFFLYSSWLLLMRREALERLQAEGVQGLKGCRTELRFRQKNPPELLELELLPRGQAHPDCLPEYRPEPCTKCGRKGWKRPEELILRASSVPPELDAFRLEDFPTAIIASERFVETVRRLGYEQDILFRELPLR
ncbi:SitI6 family double-CXXCG motif immunity protein [Hyalangium gracile]|uniref:SitI6 family double-CXXCG motif immunity protein n=1 Tax=Hyalangium gracile TaxID=394092 RepID=UPI001CCA65E8|nr:double-CXXCG motif protein [Hyalangium gracile]